MVPPAAFDTPAPPAPLRNVPAPPLIVPPLARVVIVPRLETAAPPAGPEMEKTPFPPLIVPPAALLSNPIDCPTFNTPMPPVAALTLPLFPKVVMLQDWA